MRRIYENARDTSKDALPIDQGGLGGTTPRAAVDAIGMLSMHHAGQPDGIILLNEKGELPASAVSSTVTDPSVPALDGAFAVLKNESTVLTITNYDSFTIYTVSASLGTAVRKVDKITFTAGSTEGSGSITVNGKKYDITVGVEPPVSVLTPAIVYPLNAGGVNTTEATVVASAFAVSAGSDTQMSADWELATDSAFTALVQSSYDDTTNLTTWGVAGTLSGTTYYVRTRQKGAVNGLSDWSPTVSFTTKKLGAFAQAGKLLASDGATGNRFGISVSLSSDGSTALIGAYGKTSNTGAAYVFN